MLKSQLVSQHQFIFNTLLDNFLLQCAINPSSNFSDVHTCIDILKAALIIIPDSRLQQSLQQLKEQLLNSGVNQIIFNSWWESQYLVWIKELKTTIYFYDNIQSGWHFHYSNHEILERYYNTNKFLIDCLERNYELTIALRTEIEMALLSLEKELSKKDWKWCRQSVVIYQ